MSTMVLNSVLFASPPLTPRKRTAVAKKVIMTWAKDHGHTVKSVRKRRDGSTAVTLVLAIKPKKARKRV